MKSKTRFNLSCDHGVCIILQIRTPGVNNSISEETEMTSLNIEWRHSKTNDVTQQWMTSLNNSNIFCTVVVHRYNPDFSFPIHNTIFLFSSFFSTFESKILVLNLQKDLKCKNTWKHLSDKFFQGERRRKSGVISKHGSRMVPRGVIARRPHSVHLL